MASKKGIIMTIVVLGVITAASFLVWTLPQSATISVSDYGEYLDRAQQINQVVVDGIDNNFQMLTSGELDVDEYVDTAKTSSARSRTSSAFMIASSALSPLPIFSAAVIVSRMYSIESFVESTCF